MDRLKQSDAQKQKNTWRICAIFFPDLSTATSTTTVVSTLYLLEPLAEELFAITGNFPENDISSEKIHIINVGVKSNNLQAPMLIRIPRFIILQLKMSYSLIKIASKIDIVFLAAGARGLFLPALSAKLLRKRIIILRLGLSLREYEEMLFDKTLFGIGKYIFPVIEEFLERLNCWLSDRIVLFLPNATSPALKRYASKISLSGSRFYVDADFFKVEKNLDSRGSLVGYIGRFEEVKGVMNFVKSIPLVLRESTGIKVLVGGDGPQRGEIEKEIGDARLSDRVTLAGWIPHDKLPQYLNEIKLLVIPSYSEAGPHMVFEAMACGTPVLGTPVGVMRDVIKDGETGFILEDNSPQCIARNIIRALNYPNLDQIARAARELVEREYTHEAAVNRYRSILADLK